MARQKESRGTVGVCATCGRLLEFAGHVNLDLDLRLHRETEWVPSRWDRVPKNEEVDLVQFDREPER